MDLFCLISLYFICILQKIELTESCLQDCTILQLQKQIQSSRHKPACVLFSKYVEEYTLKKKLCTLVKDRHSNERYASWNFNSFKYDERMPLPIQTPSVVPTVRCYLTPSQWYDYNDGSTVKHLHKWFQKLISIFDQRIPEASLAELDHSLHHHVLTAVGFYFISEHSYLEQLLMETQEAWRDKVNMLIVHPDSPDLRLISNKYSVKQSPSLIFIENSVKTHNEPVIQLALGPLDVNKQQIDLFMLIREMPVMTLTYANFDEVVLTKTKYYVPILVLFYVRIAPLTSDYLKAFDRVRQDMVDKDASIRFGIMEVNNSVRRVFEQTVRAAYKIGFPFSVLFSAKWHKTTVIGIDQIVIAERPTPGTFQEALTQHHFMLKSKEGKMLHLDLPWGHYDKNQITELYEGPYGSACTAHSSNVTDNTPFIRPKRRAHGHKECAKHGRHGFLSDMYADAGLEASLQYVGTLPVVSANTWHAVIERSHFRLDPYNPDGVWRRQKTKVTLVIFILAGCGSCTRNQPIFEQIQESVRHIEGASVYVMNCSQDEVTCRDQHITGYPSLVAYRSLAWLDGKHCLSDEASKTERYVRLDYHGVLLVPHVMGWFSEITSDTVINLKFGTISNDFELPVQLEATALPRHSRYLPRISGKRTDYFYPYMCFQLTCERLYGQAACVVKYSDEVPRSEYSNNFDMVITKVVLSRGDGIQTTVTQLGRTLYSTLEEESSGSIHRFHKPHRYNIHHQQRCEDDHRACTDLIVYFVRDHGRLPITGMTSQAFHTQQSFLFQDDLPVLVALVHQDNITEESAFYKTLKSIAYRFYNEFVIVSVDVDEFPSWSGQFVPHGGRHKFKEYGSHSLYVYPRLCVVKWHDHQHAAFFPPVKVIDPEANDAGNDVDVAEDLTDSVEDSEERSSSSEDDGVSWHHSEILNETNIRNFLNNYLNDPDGFLVETEHF